MAFLGWISKDSVTNEKHTSSPNDVNFLKREGGDPLWLC
jgi:hypothetical protein